jgi:glycosyltransferase involved in cell wall biosynthesis
MRIGVNCLHIYPEYTGGVNSFTFGLLDGFARVGAPHELKIFVRPWNAYAFESYGTVPHFRVIEIGEPKDRWFHAFHRRLPWQLRRRVGVPALTRPFEAVSEREADVLYVPYVPPSHYPYPDLPTVYSIHDIQQVHYPEFFTSEELRERELAFGNCVEHAAAIQASSRYMRDDFCEHFAKLNETNVEVIPEGVDVDLFAQRRPDGDVESRYPLPPAFLFTPAQLWPHKNHLTILRALKRLKDRGVVLPWVLTGAEYTAAPQIFDFVAENGLEDQVSYLGVVPYEDIVELHQKARLLVTASIYESSSIPILEAAAAGTPIVAGRIPPHEEFAEHLELRLFSPADDEELAGVLEDAWTDEETNEAQVAANRVGVRHYSWDNAARMYIDLFERLHSRESALAGGRA